MRISIGLLALALLSLTACHSNNGGASADGIIKVEPGADFQKHAQEALIRAKPGNVVLLPPGKHHLDNTLSLTVAGVTIRGAGIDQTTLSFSGQKAGSAGILATGDKFTIEKLAIEDTAGDALKVNNATGVTIRDVRVEWTGGPKETNGSYGFYPVQCRNVLIEDSIVRGASDAGIYVGQSSNIVVRRSIAEKNVAGIEIENSQDADVYENTATGNTGGILVFNLPDLPVKDGRNTRVFKNQVMDNNLPNFAPKGNMVAKVPAGTGIMVLAVNHVEVFGNTIQNNGDASLSIISYFSTGNPMKDKDYYPYVEAIYVHNNAIAGGGRTPNGNIGGEIAKAVGTPLPDILYDGTANPEKLVGGKMPDNLRICIQNNNVATFANFDAAHQMKSVSKDLVPHDCALQAIDAVNLAK